MTEELVVVLLAGNFQTYVPPVLKSSPFPKVSVPGPAAVPGEMLPAPETGPLTTPVPLNVLPDGTDTVLVPVALPPVLSASNVPPEIVVVPV